MAQPHRSPPLRTIPPALRAGTATRPSTSSAAARMPSGPPAPCPLPRRTARSRRAFGGHSIPAPIVSFEGVTNRNGLLPPDTNGDIGPDHYMQIVNVSFAVYNRNGTRRLRPGEQQHPLRGHADLRHAQPGRPGRPLRPVLRPLARVAVRDRRPPATTSASRSRRPSDPTGSWCGYEFLIHPTKFGDYPKFGVWPSQNAFFMTVNQFDDAGWGGAGVYGFERDQMLACQPARFVYKDMYDVDPSLGSLLPADADGSTAPPDGAAIPLVSMRDGAPDRLSVWSGTIDWSAPVPERHARHRALRRRPSARISAAARGTASRSRARASASSRSPTG